MKFRALFESKEVEDLTHEALTHHGFVPSAGSGSYGGRDIDHHKLHADLKSIGWKHIDTERQPSIGHFKSKDTYTFSHPETRKKLYHNRHEVAIGHWHGVDVE